MGSYRGLPRCRSGPNASGIGADESCEGSMSLRCAGWVSSRFLYDLTEVLNLPKDAILIEESSGGLEGKGKPSQDQALRRLNPSLK